MSQNDIPQHVQNDRGEDQILPRGEGFNDPLQPRPLRSAPVREPQPHIHYAPAPAPDQRAQQPAQQRAQQHAHQHAQQGQQGQQRSSHKPFAHLRPGDVIHDTYTLIEPLGQGGMGVVWKAHDNRRFNRIVALKFIKYTQDMARNRLSVDRFEREAMLSARLQHPNLTTLFDFIHLDDGTKVMALEYVAGETLAQYIKREVRLDVLTAIHIALQLSHALGHMHQSKLIHRDLKPDNIMLTALQSGGGYLLVKLIDLGIAKFLKTEERAQNTVEEECSTPITQTGYVCGTPEYMAPEQLQGRVLSPRSDIYAIGVLLFEMLAGKPPFKCTNWHMFANTRQITEIPNVRSYSAWPIPESLITVIHTCLEYNPNKRYANTHELARALEEVLLHSYAQLLPLSSIHLSEYGRTYLHGLNHLAQTSAAQSMRAGQAPSVVMPQTPGGTSEPAVSASDVKEESLKDPQRGAKGAKSGALTAARLNLSDLWQAAVKERHQGFKERVKQIVKEVRGHLNESLGSQQARSLGFFFVFLLCLLVLSTMKVQRQPSQQPTADAASVAARAHEVTPPQHPTITLPTGAVIQSSIVPQQDSGGVFAPILTPPAPPPHELPPSLTPLDTAQTREVAQDWTAPAAPLAPAPAAQRAPEVFESLQIAVNPLAPLSPLKELIGRTRGLEAGLSEVEAAALRAQLALINALYEGITPLFKRKQIERARVYQVISEARFAPLDAYGWMSRLKTCYSPSKPPCTL